MEIMAWAVGGSAVQAPWLVAQSSLTVYVPRIQLPIPMAFTACHLPISCQPTVYPSINIVK